LWKILCASSKDPRRYAKELEEGLNELSSEGYALVAMTDRGGATILHGQKVMVDPPPVVPQAPAPTPVIPRNVHHEVIYLYLEKGSLQRVEFRTVPEAVCLLRHHLECEDIVPVSLTTVVLSTFEPPSFRALLATYKEAPTT
jgi:hypothetical protein